MTPQQENAVCHEPQIKYRESFRPFAPAVKAERVSDWFEIDRPSPYMLLVAPVKEEKCLSMTQEQEKLFGIEKLNIPRSEVPAVTHVDYSARIQTVHAETNPRFHKLLDAFETASGCPVLVNTSFNVRGEPMSVPRRCLSLLYAHGDGLPSTGKLPAFQDIPARVAGNL